MGEVYDRYVDTAGNYHYTDTETGHHVVANGQRYNNHEVACIITDIVGDACACNVNSIDEWLPEYCDFRETCCPAPVGVACWEQYLKYKDEVKHER